MTEPTNELLTQACAIMREPVRGAYFHRDELGDPEMLTWQGRWAIVLWLLEYNVHIDCYGVWPEDIVAQPIVEFATVDKPTDEELLRAVVEVGR